MHHRQPLQLPLQMHYAYLCACKVCQNQSNKCVHGKTLCIFSHRTGSRCTMPNTTQHTPCVCQTSSSKMHYSLP